MKNLVQKLKDFHEMLECGTNTDWDCAELTPEQEFEELAKQMLVIVAQAEEMIPTEKSKMFEEMGQLISGGDDRDYNEILDDLVKQHEIDGEVDADDIVSMWEPLELSYTVNRLLEEIGYFQSSLYKKKDS